MRDEAVFGGTYSHSVSPVAPSSATTRLPPSRLPGVVRYMTPRYTSGMISSCPGGSGFDHARVSEPTLPRSISSSGL